MFLALLKFVSLSVRLKKMVITPVDKAIRNAAFNYD